MRNASQNSDAASATLRERSLLTTGTILSLLLTTTTSAGAQIIPDNTLPNNTIVAPNGQTINIEGGTRSGGNLFHSFQEFNLGNGSTAFFNNAADIQNILSRVTGGNISNIDGLIRANGGANLFLVNPAGIVFGPNARLDIGGSFLATSADSVVFDDGSFYSASNPNAPPLLTVNLPIGLQFNGGNNEAIALSGPGHKLNRQNDFTPSSRIPIADLPAAPDTATELPEGLPPSVALVEVFSQLPPTGLQVQPGKTLAIVGGDVVLEAATLTAYEGRIELGSVKEGNVSINPGAVGGWNLSYEGASQFGEILMGDRALLDASSLLGGGGSIQVQGQNVEMREIAVILIQNIGLEPSGDITINAVESVQLSGADSIATVRTGIGIDAIGSGDGGDINISTSRLLLEDGATLGNLTFGQEATTAAASGDINIKATDTVEILGVSSDNPGLFTIISGGTVGAANAGKLTISTSQLRVTDGASITSTSLGSGRGGEVNINATDFVEVVGVEPSNFLPSTLSAFALREGTGGNLTVNTPRLIVRGGGRVGAATASTGNAGSITINARESVLVSGTVPGTVNPSLIDSSADIIDEAVQLLFSLPPVPTGDTGNLTINTPRLTVADGAEISVQHEGTGNAGALQINAGSISIEGGGGITAGSVSGFGGNISLNVGDSLLLRDGGSIAAEAGGDGDGGNLTINAETIVLLRNSNINANAFEGSGGNISIATQGLFPSADSAISASSQLGVDGTVEVEGLDNEASKGLVQLSNNLPDLTTLITSGCEEFAGSELTVTGRGGLPPTPKEALSAIPVWQDWRNSTNLSISNNQLPIPYSPFPIPQLVEATHWMRRPDGGIELVANPDPVSRYDSWYNYPHCGGNI